MHHAWAKIRAFKIKDDEFRVWPTMPIYVRQPGAPRIIRFTVAINETILENYLYPSGWKLFNELRQDGDGKVNFFIKDEKRFRIVIRAIVV